MSTIEQIAAALQGYDPKALAAASVNQFLAKLVDPVTDTELVGVFASGEASQRITGQRLGAHQLARSRSTGDDCGRYWLSVDAGATLEEASTKVFGRPHSAVYRLRGGLAVIGSAAEPPVE